ncbi:1-phosphofructokinase [Olsenella sp. HMSC062G07]|uniref:1-phosphofructokinase n=1 Tax=Olsenella sp. HMSC062G07 TaxID=1739330 RepID=UPI0008A64BD6|nr:1-phosphofructokinase [Olsenella sp. HMSC062G07]OFK23412.1 1-phosphofructokinase [Olsenella sp. HMSC062G07]
MITTVTLNASIDKAYHMVEDIKGGTVMRVAKIHNSAGGKGLNVARVTRLCGSKVQATGLVGGFNGGYLESLAEKDGISCDFGHIAGETRSCINILDPRFGSTEFLEPGSPVSADELETYLADVPRIIANSEVVTISGSLPAGVGADAYQRLIALCKKEGKLVILDSSGEALRCGIEAGPTMIKPNKDEIEALCGVRAQSLQDVVACARELHGRGVANVVISLGGEGALLVCDEGSFKAAPPKVEAVNVVGCGDSMVAAFAVALERRLSPTEALMYAVATATASALSPNTGEFDATVREGLLSEVTIETVEERS